ncbi:hypothetical protein MHU86_12970 [Fragilaria crotonensis]|nr:hypothetical protein MHU86_12970 [Fragilaria crotonensis]
MTRKLIALLLLQLLVAPVAFAATVNVGNQESALNANLEQNDRSLQQSSSQCNNSTSASFKANIVVDIRGYPGLINWREKRRVGNAIMDAHNELVSCGTGGPYRQITSVQVQSVSFEDVGEAIFSLNYEIRGTCKGCTVASNGIAQLFTYVQRNSPTTGPNTADPCPCQGPSIFSFRVLLKQRIELMICCHCLYGCPSQVEEWQFYDIGDKFVEVYNRINGENARLCDPFFRRIESAIPVLVGGNVTDVPSDLTNRRGRELLESPEFMALTTAATGSSAYTRSLQTTTSTNATCDEYFEVRFEITASCRNCDLSKITLFDELDAVNFLQADGDHEYDDDSGNDSDRNLKTAPDQSDSAPYEYWDSSQGHQGDWEEQAERFLNDGGDCQCPLDTAYRAATEDEMTAAFAPSISRSTSLTVLDVVEIIPIPCDPDVETFETSVDVDYEFESEDGTIPQEAVAAFVANFLLSYNSLQARYCDPYFREVASAEIANQTVVPTRRDRSLQVKTATKFTATVRVNVLGTCRGCKGTTRKLFVNDGARRLQVAGRRMLSDNTANKPNYRRINSEDQCFCAVANVANSAPTEREFLVGYNGELSSLTPQLGAEYVVTTVNEEGTGGDDYSSRQECTANADCVNADKGELCVNFSCIHAGNPRVTLTWTGDDDLTLLYIRTGIYFPMKGAPPGTYNIEVYSWEERGSADAWKVEVFTAASSTVPVFVTTGTGNRDDILFDFGEAGVSVKDDICSTSNIRTECCFDTDCDGSNQRCANRQCVTTAARTFTLTWSGNDDHTLTVLTPKGGRISDDSPFDPFSGAVFESDNNGDIVSRTSHTENIYFPGGYPGGQYVFYVDAIAQLGAADEWSLEVIEFGQSVVLESGYGYSKVFEYIAPECQATQHCRQGQVCINTRCVVDGTPRFTLTWDGDDDLDLSVSPPIGNRVDWWNQVDSRSGGRLQDDTTPTGTSHLESIYFGISRRALTGRYGIEVDPYETNGDASDPWKLQVSVRGKVVKSWNGTGEASLRYWYGF